MTTSKGGQPTPGRFSGKVAFITGAGSGIGRAVSVRLAAEGGTVVGVDVAAERLTETAAQTDGLDGSFEGVGLDIADRDACREAIEACVARHGRLDVLGNIAGIVRGGHAHDFDPELYRKLMSVNVDGSFFLAQAAIPHLLETSGNIVNIASNAGVHGAAYIVPYAMTKGAIVQMTKSLAIEYIKTGLRVNAIAPGGTDTRIAEELALPKDCDFDLVMRMRGMRSALNDPAEVAALFALIASDDAPGLHGAILRMDHGLTVG